MRYRAAVPLIVGLAYLVACGGGGGDTSPTPVTVGAGAPTSAPSAGASSAPTGAPIGTPTVVPSVSASPTLVPSGAPTVAAPTPTPTAAATTLAPTAVGVVNATNSPNALDDNPGRIDGNQSTFNATGAITSTPIDGVPCTRALEKTVEHFHDHLSLYVNGQQYAIPAAIGIYHPKLIVGSNSQAGFWNIDPNDTTSCHYLVHVHAGDGVIHMESPTTGVVFHLKDFLDIWGVTKTTTGFLTFTGPTRWFMTSEYAWNPGHYRVQDITNVDPATITLTAHVEFTVEVGTPLVNILNYNFIDAQL